MTHRPSLVAHIGVLAVLALVGAGALYADGFDVPWWAADAGGATCSTGGGFSLGATIGQPDAQPAPVMTGGGFELSGGFRVSAIVGPAICPGDTNCDGGVTFADIDRFVEALGGESAWTHAPCPWLSGDCNHDGGVTFADIDGFVALIGTPCP